MADKNKNLQEIPEDDLHSELAVLEGDLRKMSLEQSVRGIADNSQFKKMRKNIARVNTELRKRDLSEYTPEELENAHAFALVALVLKKAK